MTSEMTQSPESTETVEQLHIPENMNPGHMEDIAILNAEEQDILDEISMMDTFREHQLDLAREMRGFTSDCY